MVPNRLPGPQNKPWGYEVLGRPRNLRPRACSHLLQEHRVSSSVVRRKGWLHLTIHLPLGYMLEIISHSQGARVCPQGQGCLPEGDSAEDVGYTGTRGSPWPGEIGSVLPLTLQECELMVPLPKGWGTLWGGDCQGSRSPPPDELGATPLSCSGDFYTWLLGFEPSPSSSQP